MSSEQVRQLGVGIFVVYDLQLELWAPNPPGWLSQLQTNQPNFFVPVVKHVKRTKTSVEDSESRYRSGLVRTSLR